jgi:hypothetical protein
LPIDSAFPPPLDAPHFPDSKVKKDSGGVKPDAKIFDDAPKVFDEAAAAATSTPVG